MSDSPFHPVWPPGQAVIGVRAFIHRVWPQTMVGIALSITTVWTLFLGYELVRLARVLIEWGL